MEAFLELAEMFLPMLAQAIVIIAVTILLPVAKAAMTWWKNLMIERWVKGVIEDSVKNAQEKYWEHQGAYRFEIAKEWVIDKLQKRGINVDIGWLEGVIESTVNRLRDEYEDWYRERQ